MTDTPFTLFDAWFAEAQTREKLAAVPVIRDVIKKPVTSAELIKRVHEVLAG